MMDIMEDESMVGNTYGAVEGVAACGWWWSRRRRRVGIKSGRRSGRHFSRKCACPQQYVGGVVPQRTCFFLLPVR